MGVVRVITKRVMVLSSTRDVMVISHFVVHEVVGRIFPVLAVAQKLFAGGEAVAALTAAALHERAEDARHDHEAEAEQEDEWAGQTDSGHELVKGRSEPRSNRQNKAGCGQDQGEENNQATLTAIHRATSWLTMVDRLFAKSHRVCFNDPTICVSLIE